MIRWLLERGFAYDAIQHAIEKARADHPSWPLLEAPIGVAQHAIEGDPRGVIVLRVENGVYEEASDKPGQVTLNAQLLDEARDMLRRGGWIAAQLQLERIEVSPGKLGGAPSLRGRRWPIERIAQIAADDEGRALLIDDYGIDDGEIEESLRWTVCASAL